MGGYHGVSLLVKIEISLCFYPQETKECQLKYVLNLSIGIYCILYELKLQSWARRGGQSISEAVKRCSCTTPTAYTHGGGGGGGAGGDGGQLETDDTSRRHLYNGLSFILQ